MRPGASAPVAASEFRVALGTYCGNRGLCKLVGFEVCLSSYLVPFSSSLAISPMRTIAHRRISLIQPEGGITADVR